ncbi:AAA family ATPase [Limnothrix sp. FACHB-708]|uniref:AAA family ATPase n=1 Tax=unclassified Limnothrix TaxID=2632864 RepID=UPI0016872E71|nr:MULTISPECIES: AAA family ATPase [unclassified Limnothrix]MBD2552821.1 AAA family ATPase [Limnothrix sp. FACHB-708]MBD2590091.1 AAA family ATPase [Limnothrix sp. FACHB-406]
MTTATRVSEQSIPNIPGYTITEQLYRGSRTAVYRAVQDGDQRSVVLKILLSDYPTFGELVQFRNQYAIAKNLNLPGIIHPLTLQPFGNGYVMVMEDWGGVSLNQYLQQHQLNWVEVLKIALQLTTILHDLHQQRVIHKDIKPANILIDSASKEVKLIDFSIASLLPKETQEIQNPNILEGTLAYLAPEQTGRMNRGIDYRADYYALGVTLYQLLTGQLPFESGDPLELLHCHIAKATQPVDQVNPSVPEMVGAIVAKLMAKNAEDRYQSALGLQHDLQQCLNQWEATGTIASFELGQRDLSDRFLIPEKLYGRESEVQILLKSFERVSQGASELMLVAGFSGIGKTAVVNEVHKPITQQKGYFIKGKFDQFNRNIPLSAFVQALRDLMGQLLSESDSQLAEWKAQILKAVGENGQVLIEVIPELEEVIGQQPIAPELSGTAAQNRFNLLFQKFIQVFTTANHPLVIFLDDLQWSDSASLQLLKVLMESSGYLLMLGAYRDNEVSPVHPLILTIGELEKANLTVNTITLLPLSLEYTNCLVADTLRCSQELSQPLTQLVDRKTQGNPFFTTQFLKALHEDGYIVFDRDQGYWQCDIAQVNALALTDDVVEFMALQLQKLPTATQEVLKLAACIGAQFDLQTLAIVAEQSQTEAATCLWRALQEGLIIPITQVYKFFQSEEIEQIEAQNHANPAYRFLHDRVQQAAYSLIPQVRKQATHLKVGQLLLNSTPQEKLEVAVFDIVNHLNIGIDTDPYSVSVIQLAELALLAGMKAKISVAYQASIEYFNIGLQRLSQEIWDSHYHLMLNLYREKAECSYLVGEFSTSETLLNYILEWITDPLDTAQIYSILMTQRMTLGTNMLSSVEAGIKGLAVLEMVLPTDENELKSLVEVERQQVQTNISQVSVQGLLNLPEMTEPVQQSCMKLLAILYSASYLAGNQLLNLLTTLRMVNLSLRYGRAESSSFAYCCYGMMLAFEGNYQSAYEFGKVALDIDRMFKNTQFMAKNNNHFAHIINPFSRPLAENIPLYKQSAELCAESGDLVFGAWAIIFLIWSHLLKGTPLLSVQEEIQKYFGYVEKTNDQNMLGVFQLQRQFVRELIDDIIEDKTLTAPGYFEHPFFQLWQQSHFNVAISWYGFLVLQRAYFKGDYAQVLAISETLQDTLPANMGFFPIIVYHTYYPLSLAAIYVDVNEETQLAYYQQIQEHQKLLEKWAEACPNNFLHKYYLVTAELVRLSGDRSSAVDLYDRAILLAQKNEFIQEEALANELTAKFYLDWGKEKIAESYMQEAYYHYAHWGAKAKVNDLEERYPQLLQPILQAANQRLTVLETLSSLSAPTYSIHSTPHTYSTNNINQTLDLAALLQISQTFASTIALDELLKKLTQAMLENSGADGCALMLCEDDRWQVRVMANAKQVALQAVPLEDNSTVPTKLIHYVKNTSMTVVVDNLKTELPVIGDYLVQHQPKSVLCLPIFNQGNLSAILYLENRSTSGVFTSDRIAVLNFLCTQAAVSLENARLYQQSQEYSQQLEQSLYELDNTQSRFHNLVDNVPGVVYQFLMKTDGSVSMPYISNACYDLYEVTAEQAIADVRILMNMTHPEDVELYRQTIADSAQALTPWRWEGRIITPSGKVKWIHGESRIKKLADETLVWDGLLLDISEQKAASQEREAAEASLRDFQERLTFLIQQTPVGIIEWNDQFKVASWNPSAERIFGYLAEEMLDHHATQIVPESDRPLVAEVMTALLEQRGGFHSLNQNIRKDGTIITCEWINTPLVDNEGKAIGIFSMIQDVSDRILAEAVIQQKSEDLERTLQELKNAQLQMVQSEKMASLGNLVAGVAHEINNPIGFLNGSINNGKEHVQDLLEHLALYQQHYPSPTSPIQDHAEDIDLEYVCEDLPQLLNSMQGATDRIKSISTSLRTFSRADTEYKVSANLHEGIDSTLLILKYRLKANANRPAIEVITNYGEIPSIDCFPGQLNQVFMNILANAIDMFDELAQGRSFKELEAHPQQITISTTLVDDQVQITIRDNGKGMNAEVQSRIFDHLFTTKSVGKGTGLGLAIAQQIVVDKHSGSLTVESEPGQGAEFRIQLPVKS